MKENSTLLIIGSISLILLIALFVYETKDQEVVYPLTNYTLPLQQSSSTITVNGYHEQEFSPDRAILYITVSTEGKDSQETQSQNSKVTNELIERIKSEGIRDIETTDYRIDLLNKWDSNINKYVKEGVRVSNSIKITFKDFSRISKILDASQISSNYEKTFVNIGSLQFTLSDEKQTEIKTELLAQASKNAKEKADAIAKSLGTKVTKVKTIEEENINTYYPTYYNRDVYALAAEASDEKSLPQIEEQKQKLNAQVKIIFEIE